MVFPFPLQFSLVVGAGGFLALPLKPVPKQRTRHQFAFPLPMSAAGALSQRFQLSTAFVFLKYILAAPLCLWWLPFRGCKHPPRTGGCSSCVWNSNYFSAKHRSSCPVESTTNLQTGALSNCEISIFSLWTKTYKRWRMLGINVLIVCERTFRSSRHVNGSNLYSRPSPVSSWITQWGSPNFFKQANKLLLP